MKITFFDIQPWEKETITRTFPDAHIVEEKLTQDNAAGYQDVEIASCFIYSQFNQQALQQLPSLKMISTRSTGFDHIDVPYATSKNITVCNVPEYGSNTVAEHTFALILSLTRKMYQSVNQAKTLDFEHNLIRGVDLYGKTLGIVGVGKIGQNVIRMAKGFGMRVLAYNRSQDPQMAQELGFEYADLDRVIREGDIITLHLPYNKQTHHIINIDNIRTFKKGSYLINTARGGLIETEAIIVGLQEKILEGVGLDVLEEEKELTEEAAILTPQFQREADLKTLVMDHLLMNNPKVLITPHNAFNSVEALDRITQTTIENIQAFVGNNAKNIVEVAHP